MGAKLSGAVTGYDAVQPCGEPFVDCGSAGASEARLDTNRSRPRLPKSRDGEEEITDVQVVLQARARTCMTQHAGDDVAVHP